jgi:hypothetical protein
MTSWAHRRRASATQIRNHDGTQRLQSCRVDSTSTGAPPRTLAVVDALFVWLISHQPAVLFSQKKLAISNQPTVLFSQNKTAPTISHQPTEQALTYACPPPVDRRASSEQFARRQIILAFEVGPHARDDIRRRVR